MLARPWPILGWASLRYCLHGVLMKIPKNIRIYGDLDYREPGCRTENAEQKEFFGNLKEHRRNLWDVTIHPKNEGFRTHAQAAADKEMGSLNTGASDIIIPAKIPFICEMKRIDHKQSSISDDQIKYLLDCQKLGAFVCIALGAKQAWKALIEWENYY